MPIPHDLLLEAYSHLTAAVVAGLWEGLVLALMAAALIHLVPRASASLRHTALVAFFVVAALLPWIHLGGGRTGMHSGTTHFLRVSPLLAALVAAVWLIASGVRAVSLFLAWRRLCAVREQATPVALEGIADCGAGGRRALLCVSADVGSPTVIGFLDPRLLLPQWMAPLLTRDDLRQILLHECEHIRRYDDWLNLLLQVGLVLSPLNPALVWLDRRIAMQRELACDAAVVASTAQPIAYASCLTRLAEQRMHRTRLALAMAAWGRESELGQRVQALLTQSTNWTQQQSRFAASATAVVLLAGALVLARTPSFVRIVETPQTVATTDSSLRNDLPAGEQFPGGGRLVPTSFVVTPAVVKQQNTHLRRKTTTSQHAAIVTSPNEMRMSPTQPRVVRVATHAAQPSYGQRGLRTGPDETSVRFVTTEFSSPYIAVPVANGWLIFQL